MTSRTDGPGESERPVGELGGVVFGDTVRGGEATVSEGFLGGAHPVLRYGVPW